MGLLPWRQRPNLFEPQFNKGLGLLFLDKKISDQLTEYSRFAIVKIANLQNDYYYERVGDDLKCDRN